MFKNQTTEINPISNLALLPDVPRPMIGGRPSGIMAAGTALSLVLASGTVTSKQLKQAMNDAFGGSDATGAWAWKDAYEALEIAQILFVRKYGHAILGKGDDTAMAMFVRILSGLPTQTRRSEEMVEFQQFSTPLPLAFLTALAAGITKDDIVLEPSAGTGLLAIFGEIFGGSLILNELSQTRRGLLEGTFPGAGIFGHNAEQLHDRMDESLVPSVVLMNPPFSSAANTTRNNSVVTLRHLSSALARLVKGGRLVLITGENFKPAGRWLDSFTKVQEQASLVFSCALPANVFAKHGTSFDTRLSVFDKIPSETPSSFPCLFEENIPDLVSLAKVLKTEIPARRLVRDQGMARDQGVASVSGPNAVALSKPTAQLPDKANRQSSDRQSSVNLDAAEIEIVLKNFEASTDAERVATDDVSFVPWVPQTFEVKGAQPHVSQLCQSAAMASVAPPKPTYKPRLFPRLVEKGVLSDAQLETIVYAGQAHSGYMDGWFLVNDDGVSIRAATEADGCLGDGCPDDDSPDDDSQSAVQYRRGFFLGDGTGAGKGRQIAGVFLDNWNQGRKRGVWISASSNLLQDSRRDWSALGMDETQIVPLNRFKSGSEIKLHEGILFTTFATLRSEGRGGSSPMIGSRIEQVMKWLGEDFDGVIAFDEAHSMANAVASHSEFGKGSASLQGLAGLRLQFGLPQARVLYASATAGSDVSDLAYGERLGLWGSPEMPFDTRDQFISDMTQGGIAAMEMIARDLKALGVYTSRVLSYEGVEVDPLIVNLSTEQIRIYDLFADAFQIIHQNLQRVLVEIGAAPARGAVSSGGASSSRAKGAALSVFESTKQRFFSAILTGMVGPKLIKEIERDLEADRAPVLQLVSTSEAVLERRLADIPPSEWNDLNINITPVSAVTDYLNAGFPIELYEEYEVDGEVHTRKALDAEGNPVFSRAAIAVRDDLIERIASLPAIPSILDQILHHFGEDVVAEVTGRSRRILLKDGRYFVSRRSGSSNVSETESFLDDKKKILIFSDAGGTGRSYHAGLEFINQRQRVHYLVEPGWKADRAVQGLGRTKRTNQASEPVFRPVSTDVKGQRRFISTIARRLDALGAITRGQREGGTGELFRESDNLESVYARQALSSFYRLLYNGKLACIGMSEFEERTGLKLTAREGGLREDLPPIQRFLNRILALRIDMQNRIFDDFDALHNGAIERAKETGSYQMGVEQLSAHSLVAIDRKVIREQEGTGAQTSLIQIERKDRLSRNDFGALLSNGGARAMVNTRSKRAAVLLPHSGYTDEDGVIRRRFRLYRPGAVETVMADGFDETSWVEGAEGVFKEYWEREAGELPQFITVRFYMVTGLLLPLWKHMPRDNPRVRRLVLDNGERLLGRIVSSAELVVLNRNLGIDQEVEVDTDEAWGHIMATGGHAELAGDLKLRRSMVAGDYRIEITSATGWEVHEKDRLKALGCTTEIIQSCLRVFIPANDVFGRVTKHNRVVSLN